MMWIWKSKNRPEYPENNKHLSLSVSLCLPFSFSFPKDVTGKKVGQHLYETTMTNFVRCFVMCDKIQDENETSLTKFLFFSPKKNTEQFFLLFVVFLATIIIRKKSHHLFTSFVFTSCFSYVLISYFVCFVVFVFIRCLFEWLVYWLNITCCVKST